MQSDQTLGLPHTPRPADDPKAPDATPASQSASEESARRTPSARAHVGAAASAWISLTPHLNGSGWAGRALAASRAALTRGHQWIVANSMEPLWLAARWRHPATGYAVAAVGQLLATVLTVALFALFPGLGFRSSLLLLVTVLIALTFGAGPSLFAALWGAVLVDYAILPPRFALSARTPTDFGSILLYTVVGVTISVLPSQVARARRAAEQARATAVQAEAEAARRAEQLQSTFDAMGDALALYDTDLRLVKQNAAFVALFGFADDPAMVELPIERRYAESVILDERGQVVPLDQLPQVRALRGESSVGDRAVDLHVRTRSGREVDVNLTAAPVRDPGDRIVGAVAIFRDVTQRHRLEKRTHEALEALLEMAQVLVTTSPESAAPTCEPGLSATREGGNAKTTLGERIPPARQAAQRLAELTRSVLGCERVAITEVDPATERMHPLAVVGLTPEQEAHMWATWPADARLSNSVNQEQIASLRVGEILTADMGEAGVNDPRNPYRARSVLVAPGLLRGQLVCMLTTDYGVEPHVYSIQEQAVTGAVTQLVALVIERERLVRERAQAEARELALLAAHEQMDQFLSLASHELRTPLTTVKANVQIMSKRVSRLVAQSRAAPEPSLTLSLRDTEAMEAALLRAEQAMVRQERLVNDLLDVSRIQSGKLEHHLAPVDLIALTREVVDEHQVTEPQRAITLAVPEKAVTVEADDDRIRQVLANYLINALRYAPTDQPIGVSLKVEIDANVARVGVCDEGPGVAPSERERIWERFHRAPGISHTSGSGVGLGLGLYISREIIERHGGRVGVESEEGHGAEFWFTLPVCTGAGE